MNRRDFAFLLISIFLHGLVAALWLAGREPESRPVRGDSIGVKIVSEAATGNTAVHKGRNENGRRRRRSSRGRRSDPGRRQLTLKDLLPAPGDAGRIENANSGSAPTEAEAGAAAWRRNFKPVYRYIFDRLNENLDYPPEFAAKGIEGTAKATLIFSKQGYFLKSASRVQSLSNYVKVAVWRALRSAFSEPIPSRVLDGFSGDLRIEADFTMAITEGDLRLVEPGRQLFAGDRMFFYRSRQHSKLEWDLGPFHGLAPLPTVAVNPLWFTDAFKKLFTKKAVVDPLAQYRDDPDWDR